MKNKNGPWCINSMREVILLAALLVIVSACSGLGSKKNTGSIEHRHATYDKTNQKVTYNKFFLPCDEGEKDCEMKGLIKEGDSVAIKLLTAYICDFAEDNPFPTNLTLWVADSMSGQEPFTPCSTAGQERSKHYTKGEIAILASVFELGGKESINFSEGNSDLKSARVVYYDDDVRESGQFLNMANMPIYGPITYGGGPLYLRLVMLELDNEENSYLTSLLSTIADFGKMAYPPASEALGILNGIGSTLLSGDQDDIEFRYDMVFDPPGGEAAVYLPLKVGVYVLVRRENRSEDHSWPKKQKNLDPKQAKLADDNGKSIRTDTYFVINVTRNEKAIAQDSFQTFANLAATEDDTQMDLSGLVEVAEVIGARIGNTALYDDLRFRATELVGNANAVDASQHKEVLKSGICVSVKAMEPKKEGEETKLVAHLSQKQLLHVLAIAGPQLAGLTKESPGESATIGHWVTECAKS